MAAEQHIHNQSERLTTGLRFFFQMDFDFRLILIGGVGLINQGYRVRVDIVGMGWDGIGSSGWIAATVISQLPLYDVLYSWLFVLTGCTSKYVMQCFSGGPGLWPQSHVFVAAVPQEALGTEQRKILDQVRDASWMVHRKGNMLWEKV